MITAKDLYEYWKNNRDEFHYFRFTLKDNERLGIICYGYGEIGYLYIDNDLNVMIFSMSDGREDPFYESPNDAPYYEIDENDSVEYVLYKGIDLALSTYECLINKYGIIADRLSELIP